VDAYNQAVGTLEARVLPAARRFRDLKSVGGDRDIDILEPLTQETRALTAPEFRGEGE
jgi:DNA recombination protein RmuC